MKNYKHSLCALLAIVMVGSLVKVQGQQIINENKETAQRIKAVAAQKDIVIAEREVDETLMGAAFVSNEEEVEVAQSRINDNIADKASYRFGYVKITSDTLSLRDGASEDATSIGQLSVVEQVEILGEEGNYYKVKSASGEGYASKEFITEDKEEAEYAALSFTNYKEAEVSVSSVNLRREPNTDSSIIKVLPNGEKVVVLWGEGEFIRVAYGESYDEGYVINTSIEFTGNWIEKSEFAAVQEKVAQQREAQRQAEIAANASKNSSYSKRNQPEATSASSKGQAIVNTAMKYLGVPYVWGGTSPRGFDCSGLVQYCARANGIRVNRVAADQRNNGYYVSRANLQPGDLVFFAKNGGRIHHVGIYVGNGNMIHAPQTGDVVKISSIETSYRVKTYAGAVRLY